MYLIQVKVLFLVKKFQEILILEMKRATAGNKINKKHFVNSKTIIVKRNKALPVKHPSFDTIINHFFTKKSVAVMVAF